MSSQLKPRLPYFGLLVGSTLLLISPGLYWWQEIPGRGFYPLLMQLNNCAMWWLPAALWTAGAAGLLACFCPNRLTMRLLPFFCLPAMVATVCSLGRMSCPALHSFSSLASEGFASLLKPRLVLPLVREAGPGFHFALVGWALMTAGYFVLRAYKRPEISPDKTPTGEDVSLLAEWRRIRIFTWLSIVLFIPAASVSLFISSFGLRYAFILARWTPLLILLGGVVFLALAIWLVGPARGQFWPPVLNLDLLKYCFAGVALSVLVPALLFLCDCVRHAVLHSDTAFLKSSLYEFHFPAVVSITYVPSVIVEEVVWRGYLLPRFMRRFGNMLGILLVGASWAAAHFTSILISGTSDFWALFNVLLRIVGIIVLSLVLSWLRLKSGSVIPAIFAHGIDNVMISAVADDTLANSLPARTIAWLLIAVILFRFWFPKNSSGRG
jgi:membrane protease YdiL (CAAX protease family)